MFYFCFIPTKGTTYGYCKGKCLKSFQSTFPRRERPTGVVGVGVPFYFNPRSPEGNDPSLPSSVFHFPQVQSTFPRRERRKLLYCNYQCQSFQSTFPRRERRRFQLMVKSRAMYFNPRSHEGNDLAQCYVERNPTISIHVPTKGTTTS